MQNCKKRVTWHNVLVNLSGYVVAMDHLDASGAAPSRRSWEAKDALTMREEPITSSGR
jgi:hypothetical protein